jgi:nucleotide-binding universal stress UspA family protein
MELRTILVNLDIDSYSPSLLKAAVDLGQRFGARISGVAAAAAPSALMGIQSGGVTTALYEAESTAVAERLTGLALEFNEAVPPPLRGTCVTSMEAPDQAVLSLLRRADLVLVGSRPGLDNGRLRTLDVGTLLLAAGRPVLILAPETTALSAETIVVGWKDTREARRAVADALPLLKTAKDVVVVTVSEGDLATEKGVVGDVAAWLASHDVKARGDVYDPQGRAASTLEEIAREFGSDLIVTGAYGHSRAREWFFGGVTRDLLAVSAINRFMSN